MLRHEGRYIYIEEQPRPAARKTPIYDVYTSDLHILIAQIHWYSLWRRYAMFPVSNTVWESRCLTEIVQFLETLMATRPKVAYSIE